MALGRMLDCCHHHDHQRTIAMATPMPRRSRPAERQAAAMVLARQAALRAVKRRIQKEGRIKLGSVPLSTLTRLGNDSTPCESTQSSPVEAAQSDIVQNLQVTNRKRRLDPTTKSLDEKLECKMGPDMTVIGLTADARVSTDGQSLEAQHAALTQAGAERVFAEKISGAVTDRKQLAKAIAALSAGDVLLVTRETLRALTTRARARDIEGQ